MEKTAGGPLGCEIFDCKQGATPPSRRPPRGKLFQEFGRSSRAEPEVNSPRPPPLLGPRRVGVRLRQPPAPAREWRPLPGMLRDAKAPRGTGGAGGSGAPRWGRARPEGTVHSRRGRKEPGATRRGRAFPEGTRCAPLGPCTPGRDRELPEGTRCASAAPRTPERARVLSRSRGLRGAAARRRYRAGRPRPCRRSPGRTRCPCSPRKAGGGRAGRRAASAGRCPG